MRLLIDTNVFLKLTFDPQSIPLQLREAVDQAEQRFVSTVSAWEMTIKVGVGKLRIPAPAAEFIRSRAEQFRASILGIDLEHLRALERLPFHHRDPFDRLIIAQAITENLTLATSDRKFGAYGVDLI